MNKAHGTMNGRCCLVDVRVKETIPWCQLSGLSRHNYRQIFRTKGLLFQSPGLGSYLT